MYIWSHHHAASPSYRNGRLLGVCASVDNCRLFVGGIPKTKKREEILSEMKKVTEGVMDVIVYPSAADKSKNRGFAFVEYESHRAAAMARRKLLPGRHQSAAFSTCQTEVMWLNLEICCINKLTVTLAAVLRTTSVLEGRASTKPSFELFTNITMLKWSPKSVPANPNPVL